MREARGLVNVAGGGYYGGIGPYAGAAVPTQLGALNEPDWRDRQHRRWRREDWPADAPGHWRRHRHHGPPFPFLLFFIFFGLAHMGMIVAALALAMMTAALVVTAIVLISQSAAPALRQLSARAMRGSRRLAAPAPRYSPADLRLPGPALGPDAYRQRLLEVLKERYVRGEIALAEFEARVTQVVRDPSVKHLG